MLTSTLVGPISQLGRLPRGIGPFWAGGALLCLLVWAPGRSPNVCRHGVLRARFTCLRGPEDPVHTQGLDMSSTQQGSACLSPALAQALGKAPWELLSGGGSGTLHAPECTKSKCGLGLGVA